ncbi:hypothetical protein [Komagataeibacter medellinensis]|uniref:hypothetical protein n=1 Tax=Komagataeibacter medellinensis TaxID=1177712 RepID=UPI0003A29577|nr:hypothetical protein [Komagataeibacter medellinensis]
MAFVHACAGDSAAGCQRLILRHNVFISERFDIDMVFPCRVVLSTRTGVLVRNAVLADDNSMNFHVITKNFWSNPDQRVTSRVHPARSMPAGPSYAGNGDF